MHRQKFTVQLSKNNSKKIPDLSIFLHKKFYISFSAVKYLQKYFFHVRHAIADHSNSQLKNYYTFDGYAGIDLSIWMLDLDNKQVRLQTIGTKKMFIIYI